MSILRFLGVIAETNVSRLPDPATRNRKLALESLEGRAMLTLLDPLVSDATTVLVVAEPLGSETMEVHEEPIVAESADPVEPIEETPLESELDSPPPLGGEGSGDGSGGGSGGDGGGGGDVGSGSGTGGGEPLSPAITSLECVQDNGWVRFIGTAEDDEALEDLTVYFSTSTGLQFEGLLYADGTFASVSETIEPGTQITAYFIDLDGNHSPTVSIIV